MKHAMLKIGFRLLRNFFSLTSIVTVTLILIVLGYFRVVIAEFLGWNLISYYIGFAIFWICLMFLIQIGEKIHKRVDASKLGLLFDKYRKPTFIEKYGADYKEPKIKDFALTQEELSEYWSKFKIDTDFTYSMISTPIGVVIMFLKATNKIDIFIFCSIAIVLTFILIAFKMIVDKKQLDAAKRLKQFNKVKSYLNASKIYHEIQMEKWLKPVRGEKQIQ